MFVPARRLLATRPPPAAGSFPAIRCIDADNKLATVDPGALQLTPRQTLVYLKPCAESGLPIFKVFDRRALEQQRREQERARSAEKRHARAVSEGKEVHLGASITDHDFGTKMGRVGEFLERGIRVRIVIEPKGVRGKAAGAKEEVARRVHAHLGGAFPACQVVEPMQVFGNRLAFAVLNKK